MPRGRSGFEGKKHTPEAKAQIAESNRGQKRSAESKANISAGLVAFYERERAARLREPDKKRCCACETWKPLTDFSPSREKLRSGRISIRPASRCKKCAAAAGRAYRAKLKAAGVDMAARDKRYNETRDKKKVKQRAREQGMFQRREEGKPTTGGWKKYRHNGELETGQKAQANGVHIEPLASFLEGEVQREDAELDTAHANAMADTARGLIAKRCGVPVRRLYSILTREYPTISLDIADRIFTGLGCPEQLQVLYPDVNVGYHVIDPAPQGA